MALEIVLGLIKDKAGRILIAQRSYHKIQGGLWEFPGGKVEPNEASLLALKRELWEELGIKVQVADYISTIEHQYGERPFLFHLYWVNAFEGEPFCREKQRDLRWVEAELLKNFAFPEANLKILECIARAHF